MNLIYIDTLFKLIIVTNQICKVNALLNDKNPHTGEKPHKCIHCGMYFCNVNICTSKFCMQDN